MPLKTLIFTLFLSLSFQAWSETVRVRGSQSEFDSTHDYYIGLIKLAFNKAEQPLTIQYSPYMVQQRALSELEAGRLIDIYWAGTDSDRETRLGYVPIPLIKGLLGYRVFTTHKKNFSAFSDIQNLEMLKEKRLCQGAHWPDTDIMLAAGLDVMPNPVYENMFKQTYAGRCFAFPRGINEAHSEVSSRQSIMPELIVYDELILHYPFPMYFFTNKNNQRLINILNKGLLAAIEDGSFDTYLKSHPSTKHLFPLSKWRGSRILSIKNPFLSPNLDYSNRKLWVDLSRTEE